MKNGKNPTVAERRYLQSINLNSDWLISKKTSEFWLLVHKHTGQVREILAP
ncbi:hypothetical protein MTP04_24770 [Lysinibacillus sp. PLM2]|nr:hypothetical protein MTP04_24770 [Lysinibacillus sp. PLM2]